MFLEHSLSKVFGSSDIKLESALKNPKQFGEAIIYEALSSLSTSKKKEFINSKEAKEMIKEGYITTDTLERLASESDNGILKTTVCHMAKENGDPLWDEFIHLRMQERRIMNDLIEKYSDKAEPVIEDINKKFIASIPSYFREN